jgi:hypothetical protein
MELLAKQKNEQDSGPYMILNPKPTKKKQRVMIIFFNLMFHPPIERIWALIWREEPLESGE